MCTLLSEVVPFSYRFFFGPFSFDFEACEDIMPRMPLHASMLGKVNVFPPPILRIYRVGASTLLLVFAHRPRGTQSNP